MKTVLLILLNLLLIAITGGLWIPVMIVWGFVAIVRK